MAAFEENAIREWISVDYISIYCAVFTALLRSLFPVRNMYNSKCVLFGGLGGLLIWAIEVARISSLMIDVISLPKIKLTSIASIL